MNISYCGHSCFKLETKPEGRGTENEKLVVYIDPFNKDIGLKPPQGKADLVLVTHDHHDHNDANSLRGDFFLIKNPGEYTFHGVSVEGMRTFHDNSEGSERGLNTVYVLESEGIRVCHLGDLGHVPNKDQIDQIGEIDVLMIPVGGIYTLDLKEAVEVVKLIEPSVVIPMHFKTKDVNIEELKEAREFYKELGMEPSEKESKLNIRPGMFREDEIKVIELTV